MQKTIVNIEVLRIPDEDPDISYLEQAGFEARREAYCNAEFGFIGIRAVAEVLIDSEFYQGVQRIVSSGLWGIEDDSEKSYLKSVEVEEVDDLFNALVAIGLLPEYVEAKMTEFGFRLNQ